MTFALFRRNNQDFPEFPLKIAMNSYDFCSGEQIAGRLPGTFLWKSLIICMESARIRKSWFSMEIAMNSYDFCKSEAPQWEESLDKSLDIPKIASDLKSLSDLANRLAIWAIGEIAKSLKSLKSLSDFPEKYLWIACYAANRLAIQSLGNRYALHENRYKSLAISLAINAWGG